MIFNSTLSLLHLTNFLRNTIIGVNRVMHRTHNDRNSLNDSLRTKAIFSILIIGYLNRGYKALIYSTNGNLKRIEDKDEYWITEFNKFCNPGQSYICALHKILVIVTILNNLIDYSKLDISSLENFTNSLNLQLDTIIINKSSDIYEIRNHLNLACNGDNIKDCDPKVDLFNLI
jgi:hypothetical protein